MNRANETIQCENCDRILEERYNDFRVVPVNIERESPYCVVPDDALAQHKFEEKLEGDPYYASGFITAFSQISVQQQGAFTLTARTFAGELAELERILGELDLDPPNTVSDGAAWSFRSSAQAGSVDSGKGAASAQESKESDKTAHSAASAAPAAPASAVAGQHGAPVDSAAGAHTPMVTGAKGEVGRSQTDGRFVSMGRRGDVCNEQQRSGKLRHLLIAYFALLDISLTFRSSYPYIYIRKKTRSSKLRHLLIAYFALLDISLLLPVSRDEVDEALRLFHKYCQVSPNIRLKNVESLAIASLVLVVRRAPSTLTGMCVYVCMDTHAQRDTYTQHAHV